MVECDINPPVLMYFSCCPKHCPDVKAYAVDSINNVPRWKDFHTEEQKKEYEEYKKVVKS